MYLGVLIFSLFNASDSQVIYLFILLCFWHLAVDDLYFSIIIGVSTLFLQLLLTVYFLTHYFIAIMQSFYLVVFLINVVMQFADSFLSNCIDFFLTTAFISIFESLPK